MLRDQGYIAPQYRPKRGIVKRTRAWLKSDTGVTNGELLTVIVLTLVILCSLGM